MQNLEKRVAALEQGNHVANFNIVVRYDGPGQRDAELWSVQDGFGQREHSEWARRPDESERDFINRAFKEVKRNAIGVAILMQNDTEQDHAKA